MSLRAFEKLRSLSSISHCATAMEHFCSIEKGVGEVLFVTRNPLQGIVQKTNLDGIVQKILPLDGVVQSYVLEGSLKKMVPVKGVVQKISSVDGDLKC